MDIVNGVLVGLLIVALFGVNFVVDPYDANRVFDLGLEKRDVTAKLNYFNWKFAQYRADPKPVILLGDSRVDAWPIEPFEQALGKQTFNFGFGGGTSLDAFDAFWFAVELGKVERVYLALNLAILDDAMQRNPAKKARQLLDQPVQYYLSPSITRATTKVVGHAMAEALATSEKPPMNVDEFWKHQLEAWDRITGEHYKKPTKIMAELRKVAAHCKEKGIKLQLVLNPTHADVAAMRKKRGLDKHWDSLKSELAKVAPTYDFDWAGPLTENRANFGDPFHLATAPVKSTIDQVLAGKGPDLVRL